MKNQQKIEFNSELVAEVRKDFFHRRDLRKPFEAQWKLNTNFVLGNQYCDINGNFEVVDADSEFPWQQRQVFNHIASILETRLAKLERVRPRMSVAPASNDDKDIKTAKVATSILQAVSNKKAMSHIISQGTLWSELTGSVFYKVVWDNNLGKIVGSNNGNDVHEGDVRIDVCPPYEIYPDSLSCADIDHCHSIIHARMVLIDDIKRVYGVEVSPEKGDFFSYTIVGNKVQSSNVGDSDYALLIEKFTRPDSTHPLGDYVVVAGQSLLNHSCLPFINGEDGERTFPFVAQHSLATPGCFFGSSMIERAIPIQKAYNAVKNRKHEFLNRLTMGVLAVEDGSVELDSLSDGLAPGKVITFRQGSNPPRLLSSGSVPADFTLEEQRLLNEFVDVSGISEIMRSSSVPNTITSGAAIQLLVEQDDTRISVTAENVRNASKKIAQLMLRLFKQFARQPRLTRFVSNNKVELISWNASSIASDDIIFESSNEINNTIATKQSMMFDLLRAGLLYDENGKLSDNMRYKLLESFGYGGFSAGQSLNGQHIARAEKENIRAKDEDIQISDIDNHKLHIETHTSFMLSSEFEKLLGKYPQLKDKMLEHIRLHKKALSLEKELN